MGKGGKDRLSRFTSMLNFFFKSSMLNFNLFIASMFTFVKNNFNGLNSEGKRNSKINSQYINGINL